jgi:hypothetical protein
VKIYPTDRYVPGTYKRSCDVCGFDYLRSEMRKRWDGAIVCEQDYEEEDIRYKNKIIPKEQPFKRD